MSKNHSSVEHLEQINRRARVQRTASVENHHVPPKSLKEVEDKVDEDAGARQGLSNVTSRDAGFDAEDSSPPEEVRGASAVTQHF